jgi:uncharacterized oligopeptide transporter (OPT) family protein
MGVVAGAAIPAVSAIAVAFAGAAADVLLVAVVAAAAYQQNDDKNDPQAGVVVVHTHIKQPPLLKMWYSMRLCG